MRGLIGMHSPAPAEAGGRAMACLAVLAMVVGACSSSTATPTRAAATAVPTATAAPTAAPTVAPTTAPAAPTQVPSAAPTSSPTAALTAVPTVPPTSAPTPKPTPRPTAPAADVTVIAENVAFTTTAVTAKAGKPFTIGFLNLDPGIPHSIHVFNPGAVVGSIDPTATAFRGEVFSGVAARVYQLPALKAGIYPFNCAIHADMEGTLTIK